MAKKYEPPEIYSESIDTIFIKGQDSCEGTWEGPGAGMNDMIPGFCASCTYVEGSFA